MQKIRLKGFSYIKNDISFSIQSVLKMEQSIQSKLEQSAIFVKGSIDMYDRRAARKWGICEQMS